MIDGKLESFAVQDCFYGVSDALESATEQLPTLKTPRHKKSVTPEFEELMKRRRKIITLIMSVNMQI